jgi:hypothetical protein
MPVVLPPNRRLCKSAKSLHDYKFWPHVTLVDNVFGDRNPVCSCVGMENYSSES